MHNFRNDAETLATEIKYRWFRCKIQCRYKRKLLEISKDKKGENLYKTYSRPRTNIPSKEYMA